MQLAIAEFHGGRVVALMVTAIFGCVVVFKFGGTPALKFLILLIGIEVVNSVLSRFCEPMAECIFTGLMLSSLLIIYRDRWWKGLLENREKRRIEIIKMIFFILAVIGVCALVFKFYRNLGII